MSSIIQVWLFGTLRGGTSLMFAATGGLLSERSGVINIGLEGMMLFGAFSGAVFGYFSQSAIIGVLAAMLGGGLFALIHAIVVLKFKVDHVISGVAVNLVSLGITSFAIKKLPDGISNFNEVPSVHWGIMFGFAIVLTILIWLWLNYTPWGIRVQAVGADAQKASRMGLNPLRIRFFCVIASGMLAGLGGAFLSLSQTPGFSENMSSGRGYIALAALIIGRWKPFGAAISALVFGLFYQIEEWMQGSQILGFQIPNEFWLSLPYVLTLIALLGLLGRAKPPEDLGKNI